MKVETRLFGEDSKSNTYWFSYEEVISALKIYVKKRRKLPSGAMRKAKKLSMTYSHCLPGHNWDKNKLLGLVLFLPRRGKHRALNAGMLDINLPS